MTTTVLQRVEGRARRTQLVAAVADLARAIDAGKVMPDRPELDALAAICDTEHLPAEAARIRRWLRDVWP